MEKSGSSILCPVCSLYLREGITLKTHLQTHTKEKVIEALLNSQDGSADPESSVRTSSGLRVQSNAINHDTTTISVAENRFFASLNRSTVSVLPSSSPYIQSSNNQITQTTQSFTYDSQSVQNVNSVQYPLATSSVVPQTALGNSCGATLTYHQYVTSDGNIILVPVYMYAPSVVMPNNVVTTPVVNSCVVMPPADPAESLNVVNPTLETPNCSSRVPSLCSPSVEDCDAHLSGNEGPFGSGVNTTQYESITSRVDIDEEEKATDEEVANIFKMTSQNAECDEVVNCSKCPERESYHSGDTEDGKSSCTSFDSSSIAENEVCVPSFSSSKNAVDANVSPRSVPPTVSVIKVRGDLNYESDSCSFQMNNASIEEEPDNHEHAPLEAVDVLSPVSLSYDRAPSEVGSDRIHSSMSFDQANEYEDSIAASTNASPVPLEIGQDGRPEFNSSSDNATHILPDISDGSIQVDSTRENEHYILPTNDIPRSSPVSCGSNCSFVGISKSLLSSASLISSINRNTFADVNMYTAGKSETSFPDKYEVDATAGVRSEDRRASTHTKLTNYIMKLTDGNDDVNDIRKNLSDTWTSVCEPRISPFNIQTDESMPARGELSGQESLSSTENSIWELQVQQNTCVQRYSISCKNENTGVNVGLHSLITEMNFKNDAESVQMNSFVTGEDTQVSVQKVFRKVIREFHCFYCKSKFDTWKLRQTHINDEHAEEDGLTIETLFGKRIKCKLEDNVKNEDDASESIICRICNATCPTSLLLLKHLKTVHGIRKRNCVCPTCFMHFRTTEEYQEHIVKVHPYECMTCGKKFHTRPGYMLHQKRHMKVKPYSCDVCDKSFVTKQKLSEHMNIHTGDCPIKCDLCDSNFKRYSNYQQHKKYLHLNVKRKLKDFICDCGEVFHSKVKLMWHQEIHDEKPKQCPFCVERFVHTASLTRHVRKWHNENYLSEWVNKRKIKNVTCPVCNISYLHSSLQTHMKIHEGIKPYSCSECSKSFRTKWNLQLHKWTHMSRSAKPYKCKICVKAYIHKTDYDAHLRSHSNCRPYACNVCGRQFIRKYNCIRHMREHKEPRTHKCGVCGKLFSRSYYLTEHEKVHTGEKPHICHFCGKASATKSNHNKHVKMHTGARESVNSEG